jgi:hypothetical protein
MASTVDQATISAVMRVLGTRGGAASRSNLSGQEKKRLARKAAKVRWDRYYAAHPEKLKTKRAASGRKKPR